MYIILKGIKPENKKSFHTDSEAPLLRKTEDLRDDKLLI